MFIVRRVDGSKAPQLILDITPELLEQNLIYSKTPI